MPRLFRTVLRILLVLSLVVAALVLACNAIVLLSARPRIHASVESAPARPTVIVLGARVYPDRLSDVLGDRMRTALEAYRAGKAERFLLSGDHGTEGYDEVNGMKDFLLAEGVPAEDIFLDHAGFDTYDSMYRARAVFQVDEAIVVTQAFHLPRAVFVARALGVDAVGVEADRQAYAGAVRNQFREALTRVKACLDVVFRAKPKFLGEPIPVTGDSRASWDE